MTACFEALEPLKVTIDSVASQVTDQIEHIIVDGGSSDGTPGYLSTLGPNVRWSSEPDSGIGDAMNKGISRASGEWILVLHAGDTFLSKHSIAEIAPKLGHNTDILTCGVLYGSSGQQREMSFPAPLPRLTFKTILHQGAICRRSIFERLGGFDTSFRIAMDYEFFLRARQAGCRFQPVDVTLACMDDTGVSSRKDWPSLRARFSEERRAQLKHCPNGAQRVVYWVYWPLYLAYRRLRSAMAAA